MQVIQRIIEIIISLINQWQHNRQEKYGKNEVPAEVVTSPQKRPGLRGKALKLYKQAQKYEYEHDKLIQAADYSPAIYDKSIMCLHFSGGKLLSSMNATFQTKGRYANSTWGVDVDGTSVRYLPDVRNPSWTQGLTATELGGCFTHDGKIIKNINNVACSIEMVGWDGNFSDEQYEKSAMLHQWMNLKFENHRLWNIVGHTHLTPFTRNDPGIEFDWEYFLVTLCGMRKDFFDEYCSYLDELSYPTLGNKDYSERKWGLTKAAFEKINRDLVGKPKDFCI